MSKNSNKITSLLKITDNASNQFKSILLNEQKDSFVRILVDSGGCSGFSYKFSIDNSINDQNDIILIRENNQFIFVTDKVSLKYIQNSSIDWVESLTNSQFVINNPLAKSNCGCGSSFSI